MPFLILGKEYLNVNFKPTTIEKLFATGAIINLNEYNRRDYIFRHIKLVTNIHINGKKVLNFDNFSNFLTNALE